MGAEQVENQKEQGFFQKFFDEERRSRLAQVILLSIAIPLMLLIAIPFEIYCTNIEEFRVVLSDFIWCLILLFLGDVILNFVFFMVLPQKVYKIFYCLALALAVMLFIQSNYLNFDLHSLGGDEAELSFSVGQIIVDVLVWVIVFVGVILCSYLITNKADIVKMVVTVLSVILVATQFVAVMTACLTTKDLNRDGTTQYFGSYEPKIVTMKNINTVSSNKNVIVFVVDRFDGALFAEPVIENDPTFFSKLDGFTYFNDYISLYGHTYPATASMITNIEYASERERETYFDKAYANNQTISKLNDLNYSVNIYTDPYYSFSNGGALPEYVENTVSVDASGREVKQPFLLALKFVRMGLYRCAPLPLKSLVGQESSASCSNMISFSTLEEKEFSVDMKGIYQKLTASDFNLNEDKNVFNFIHLEGLHNVRYDDNWEQPKGEDRGNLAFSLKNSFKIIYRYIEQMKALGVYNDATIIITGDHASPGSDFAPLDKQKLTALFVKPSGSYGTPLQINSAPVSQDNLWATIFKSENITSVQTTQKSVFDLSPSDLVERKYLWHYSDLGVFKEQQLSIVGSGRDYNNWTETKTITINSADYPWR